MKRQVQVMPTRTKQDIYNEIVAAGVLAVIRLDEGSKAIAIADALLKGGLNGMEITFTTPGALEIMEELSSKRGEEFLVGAGTVTTVDLAENAIVAGAEFIVSPITNLEVIEVAHARDKVAIIGAFSPTEILTAWDAGADLVKVFPATALGPTFFKDVKGPLPQVKLTPTGGVSLENTADFICAGAECVGVGSALMNKKMIADNDWDGLAELAASYRKIVMEAREGMR